MIVWHDGKSDNLRMSNAAALGVFATVLGTWIRLMTYRYLGRFFRFEASIQKDHELIVSGPYSVVRHPSYTGLMLVFIGWFPWHMEKVSWVMESGLWDTTFGTMLIMAYSSISIIMFVTSYFVLERMSREDAALRKRFGKKWDDWAKTVPYSIFPGIY
jgi:protein-S-isoprenylcysteine O-methyltransferase Ste14